MERVVDQSPYLPVGVSIVCTDGTIGGGSDPNVKNYSLTVCGKAVTSANCENILEDPAGTTPRAVYDPDSKTLTLNGTIKAAAADTEQTGAIIKTEDALTITGNAALEWDGGDSDDAPIGNSGGWCYRGDRKADPFGRGAGDHSGCGRH